MKEIAKGVLRKKLAKMRHLVVEKAIKPEYLDSLFPSILKLFDPQNVTVSSIATADTIIAMPDF